MLYSSKPRFSCFYYLFIIVFIACISGCASRHAWFNPAKDDQARFADTYECEKQAATYSMNLGKPGNKNIVEARLKECMDLRGYKWVKEEDIPELRKQRNTVKSAAPAISNCQQKMDNDSYDYCTENEAAYCGDCWVTKGNKWCCTYKDPKNPKKTADCVLESKTEDCNYCLGCNDPGINGKVYTFCKQPPKNYGGPTNITITNNTSRPVDIAFVTGAEGKDGACTDSSNMISYQWIADHTDWCQKPTHLGGGVNAGYCSATIKAKSSVSLIRSDADKNKCLTGAILLGGYLSCPLPTGVTEGEFTLNPTQTNVEAVDISLVNGANYALTVTLPGSAWKTQYTNEPQQKIGPNEGIYGNNKKPGIFPPGCTDCDNAVPGKIPCDKITPNPPDPYCQIKGNKQCNIQRSGWTGGTVVFTIDDLK